MINNEFNNKSGKIVSSSELMEKYEELLSKELSFKDASLMGIEQLVTAVTMPVSKVKSLRGRTKEKFRLAANDGTLGHYKTPGLFGNKYINTAVLSLHAKEEISHSLTPKLTEKCWDLVLQAAEQCNDFSALRDDGKLKPTKIKWLF